MNSHGKMEMKLFWDIPLVLLAYGLIFLVPLNNLTGEIQGALYLVGNMVMAVSLSFEGFMRWSRFALSRDHPVLNYCGNVIIILLPFLVVYLSPLFLPVVIAMHMLSHWRSPDVQGSRCHLIHHAAQFLVFLIGFVIYLIH